MAWKVGKNNRLYPPDYEGDINVDPVDDRLSVGKVRLRVLGGFAVIAALVASAAYLSLNPDARHALTDGEVSVPVATSPVMTSTPAHAHATVRPSPGAQHSSAPTRPEAPVAGAVPAAEITRQFIATHHGVVHVAGALVLYQSVIYADTYVVRGSGHEPSAVYLDWRHGTDVPEPHWDAQTVNCSRPTLDIKDSRHTELLGC